MLFEFLHFLESFLFQGVERSSARRVGVTLRRVSLLGVTLRPVCLVTDVDALRDLLRLSVEGLGGCLTVLVLGLECTGNS